MDQSLNQPGKRSSIVLIVDDNPAIRNVVAWSLQLGGYEPIEAANGWEAAHWIEHAQKEARYPTVILLDLAMPGMNGEAFLEWLQKAWPQQQPLPSIIIITAGHADEKILCSPVKQIVTKPFHVRDLLDIVRKWAA
ncbi:MAG TPA: response regulator [Ktedonobacteraceae bacterium]|nr:response regulator [Ktedonobacteraceae bacterium]